MDICTIEDRKTDGRGKFVTNATIRVKVKLTWKRLAGKKKEEKKEGRGILETS